VRLWRDLAGRPLLRVLAPVAAVAAVAFVPYLTVRQVVPAARAPAMFVYDLSYYHRAAQRPAAALYADPEFVYPPPSRALFAPLGTASLPVALGGWLALNAALLAACAWGAVRLWERERGAVLAPGVRAALVAVVLGSGPAFQTLKYGQVNSLVLLAGLAFLWGLARDRPVRAVVALGAGAWLKLYPALLLPLAFARPTARRAAWGTALVGVGLPAALLPWLPADLYVTFFGERLPHWSGLTSQGVLNGSLAGVLTRLTLPPDAALRALDVPTPPAVRLAVTVAGAALVGATWLGWARGRLSTTRAGVLLLALVPVVSPLGWEHAYVLALPLLVAVLAEAPARGHGVGRAAVVVAAVALCLPRPPARVLAVLAETMPRGIVDLLGARMLLAVVVLGTALIATSLSRRAEA